MMLHSRRLTGAELSVLGSCGDNCEISGICSIQGQPKNIYIGDRVVIDDFVVLDATDKLIIDDDVIICTGAKILTKGYDLQREEIQGKVHLKAGSIIGANSVVGPDVTVEENVYIRPGFVLKNSRVYTCTQYETPEENMKVSSR